MMAQSTPTPPAVLAALRVIPTLDDPARLRQMMKNAREKGAETVYRAAFQRLMDILPDPEDGLFAQDAWRSIHALEELETQDRGKTIRLSRTRQKIDRDGVRKTLEDLAGAEKGSAAFAMLIERGLPELTFEAIVLKHPAEFGDEVQAAARRRLEAEGVDVAAMHPEAAGD